MEGGHEEKRTPDYDVSACTFRAEVWTRLIGGRKTVPPSEVSPIRSLSESVSQLISLGQLHTGRRADGAAFFTERRARAVPDGLIEVVGTGYVLNLFCDKGFVQLIFGSTYKGKCLGLTLSVGGLGHDIDVDLPSFLANAPEAAGIVHN